MSKNTYLLIKIYCKYVQYSVLRNILEFFVCICFAIIVLYLLGSKPYKSKISLLYNRKTNKYDYIQRSDNVNIIFFMCVPNTWPMQKGRFK